MSLDDRVAKMESDLKHVQEDVAELKTDVREIRHEVKDLRTEFSGFRVEVTREFGALRTELRTSVQQNKIWMLLIASGTVLVPTVTALAHALKWF
jgi:predicted  nucleic acid-binding Zn-ribbon protein